jgi:septum formation inhibitor MinC
MDKNHDEEYFEVEVFKKGKSPYSISLFTQSQGHGLFWDSEIREKVFGLSSCKNDTKKYDISCSENKLDSQENVSIKTSSNNNIDCGDILRFFNGDFTNKYTIILIRYIQKENTKKITEIIEINYNLELRNYLFGSITEEELSNYVIQIKAIPHGEVAPETKKKYKEKKKQLQTFYNMKINISPKVDSKSQRRVQCSITKVDELLLLFPELVRSRTVEPILRGVFITETIISGQRIRNKK